MEFRVVGRKDDYELLALCDPNGYLIMRNSPNDFGDILKNDGFAQALKQLKPSKIAFEQSTRRKWFLRLLIPNTQKAA